MKGSIVVLVALSLLASCIAGRSCGMRERELSTEHLYGICRYCTPSLRGERRLREGWFYPFSPDQDKGSRCLSGWVPWCVGGGSIRYHSAFYRAARAEKKMNGQARSPFSECR